MAISRRQLLQTPALALAPVGAGCDAAPTVQLDTSLPLGPFGETASAEEVTQGLDLSGKTLLVTGCNSGLGYETLRVLALRGAHVIGTGRSLAKATQACNSVEGMTTPVELELGDHNSIARCAEQVLEIHASQALSAVVLNAGINTFGDLELINGVEKIFAINFLGHFALMQYLYPAMLASGAGRIVHVSSRSAYTRAPSVGIDFDNLQGEKAFDAGQAYGRSKLANALFSLELARRLRGSGVTSNAIHPGLVQTNIARTAPAPLRKGFEWLGPWIAKTPAQGAATQVYAATNQRVAGVSGAYYQDCNPVRVTGSHHLFNEELAQRLWQWGERMTAQLRPSSHSELVPF